jgi:hypothetical protein
MDQAPDFFAHTMGDGQSGSAGFWSFAPTISQLAAKERAPSSGLLEVDAAGAIPRMAYPALFNSANCPFNFVTASLAWPTRC